VAIVAAMPDFPRVGVPSEDVMRRAAHGMAGFEGLGLGDYYDPETGSTFIDTTGSFIQDTLPQTYPSSSAPEIEILDWDPSLDTFPGKVSGTLPKTASSANWIQSALAPLVKAGAQVWVNQNPPGGGQGMYTMKGPYGETVYVQPAGQKGNIFTGVLGSGQLGVTANTGVVSIAMIGGIALLVVVMMMQRR